jgi:SAM-dependent methyltransferase
MTSNGAVTWHYGLVARWWALFRHDGPEIEFFRRYVEAGQPALDLACGTGRLLVPYVAEGLDVDGVDMSVDMIDHCRAALEAAQVETPDSVGLFVQPVCELDVPRLYASAFMCGGFGVGTVGDQDAIGLRRIRAHLRPGGTFAMDVEVVGDWPELRGPLPTPERTTPPRPERRQLGPDGDEYGLRQRILGVDGRVVHRELRVWRWRKGEVIGDERHHLTSMIHHREEIVALMGQAGFVDVKVVGGYDGAPPSPIHQFLVYEGRNPDE